MKLTILAVGQMRGQAEQPLYETYAKRIAQSGKQVALDGLALIEIKEQKTANEKLEAALAARPAAFIIALDERGKQMDSRQWAGQLADWRDSGIADVIFVLGAADGLSAAVRARANSQLSLGPMTWPHMLARVLVAEQLWRALSILTGHPYHRD